MQCVAYGGYLCVWVCFVCYSLFGGLVIGWISMCIIVGSVAFLLVALGCMVGEQEAVGGLQR